MQRKVREIPSIKSIEKENTAKKERVCAYARVSTLHEEQEDSFERQVSYYTNYINSNPKWELVKIYADQGLSGTKTRGRVEFCNMIADCHQNKIDRVLVKSISRFARNTVDALTYIRELKDKGIAIFFENEKIDTMTPGGEMLITILAGLSEQESRNMSTNIKWAFQKKFKKGEVVISNLYGYRRINVGEYEIIEDEAKIVRRIFREFLCGYSANQIADGLNRENIPTKTQSAKWVRPTILRMLENIKYTGNAILGKTYKPDVLSKRRIKNEGQSPQFYVENSHPGIIEKELYDLVQEEIKTRKKINLESKSNDGKYASKYPFSGMLICYDCGSKFRRLIRKRDGTETKATWVCSHRLTTAENKCKSITLRETDIEQAYLKALKTLTSKMLDRSKVVDNIDKAVSNNLYQVTQTLENKIDQLQNKAINLHKLKRTNSITESEYNEQMDEVAKQLDIKEKELARTRELNAEQVLNEQRKTKILELAKCETLLENFDTAIMKSLVQKIVVKDSKLLEIEFKGGQIISQNI